MSPTRTLYATLTLLALTLALVIVRYGPPRSRPADIPTAEFSAGRAFQLLRNLVGDNHPHPTGTEANALVRERVLAELRRLGYQPQVQEAFACNTHGTCGFVKNVLARSKGRGTAPPVLLAVHYDSVGAGPGASDDGAGVASALEVARAIRNSPPLQRDVIFLIDDGEEQGLLGAEAFCEQHPWARRLGPVVNLEARGTTGPSLMFETNRGNASIIRALGGALRRPATNSIYYTIYQLLPNDTDFTVFKRYGMNGTNFAFVGGASRYHTSRDDLAHLDLGTLQHHGENALAMVRAFASADSPEEGSGDATYFDFLTLGVISWPAAWTPILAIVAALLIIAGVVRLVRSRVVAVSGVLRGLGVFLLMLAATGGSAWLLLVAISATKAPGVQWVPFSGAVRMAFWLLPLSVSAACSLLFRRRTPAELWSGIWLIWSLIGVATAFSLPGTAYPFILPALIAGAGSFFCSREGDRWEWRWAAAVCVTLSAAVLIFPLAWLLYDGMGLGILPVVSVLVLFVLSCSLPLMMQDGQAAAKRVALVAGGVTLIASIVAAVLPSWSPESPRPLNLVFHERTDQRRAQWLIGAATGPLPQSLRADFLPRATRPYPWSHASEQFSAPLTGNWIEPHEVAVASVVRSPDGETVTLRMRAQRKGASMGVYVPSERLADSSIFGHTIPGTGRQSGDDWRNLVAVASPLTGIEFRLHIRGRDPLPVFTWELDYGVPTAGDRLKQLRPADAGPIHAGDRTLIVTPFVLE